MTTVRESLESREQERDTLDAGRIRQDFPLLMEGYGDGQRLIYLDSAATSQKPQAVLDKLIDFYRHTNANPHRGVYRLAAEATAAFEGAREKLARFVGAAGPEAVVFTRNCTEAINLVSNTWARANLAAGDEILLSLVEHHSNIVPWQLAAMETGAVLRFIPLNAEGDLELERLDELVSERTKLIAVTGASNVLGTITRVGPIVAAARRVGARVLLDGAQLVPHAPVDFQALGVDFLGLSGHKMLGPTGIGALVARPELLERLEPYQGGGGMILDVELEHSRWIESPWRFEAGTPPVAEAVALGAAIDYLEELGMERVREHERRLAAYALERFARTEGFILYGSPEPERRGATFAFNIEDGRGGIIHPHDVGSFFDSLGIAIRAGHHCAKPLMRHFDVPAMCRASCYLYNTEEELDRLLEAVGKVRAFFGGV